MAAMVLAALLVLVGPCLQETPPKRAATPARPEGDPHRVILTAAQARTGARYIRADSYWTPTEADVRPVEEGLRRRSPSDGERLPAGLLGYCRQYLGIVVKGRRMVYVNGFSAGHIRDFTGGEWDWHRRPVLVDDGGDEFFDVTYDPRERRFHGFSFHGYA